MGKSAKKSATKVVSAPAVAQPTKALKKGKREAKEVIEKLTKKQKTAAAAAEQTKALKKVPKKQESSASEEEEEEDSSSDDEPSKVTAPVKKVAAPAKPVQDSSSDDEDSSDEEQEVAVPAKNAPAVVKNGTVAASKKKDESSGNSDEEESSDEEGSGDEESSDEEEKQPVKTPKKTPQTPATSQAGGTGSKTLFVGNLSFSVEQADIEDFFKDAGEVVDVRLATDRDTGKFRGYGHVEFATAEGAQKALKLNGHDLQGREVKLDLAKEKGEYTPANGKSGGGGKSQGQTVYVRGFDTNDSEDNVRAALEKHFGTCGEITRVSIPADRDSGAVKGFAYIDFTDNGAFNKALKFDGCDFGGHSLTVNEAKPREASGGGGGRWSGGGGRSGGGRRGGGGRFGDRDGGGRRGGGRRGGGRGRGRY